MIALLLALSCGDSPEPSDTAVTVVPETTTTETTTTTTDAPIDLAALCEDPTDGATGSVTGLRDCTDGICEVEAGEFWMGEPDIGAPERCPLRSVSLSAFAIDQTEVTRAAWNACVDEGACEEVPAHCVSEVPEQDEDQQPIICVTWQQASDYCTHVGGRLPTEAEWEKAARGTDGAVWAWGGETPSCLEANYRYPNAYCELGVIEVGSYSIESAFGLVDTVGNAWEWTADWFDARYYQDSPLTDPDGPDDKSCAELADGERSDCRFRVFRGGAFNTTEDNTRGGARSSAIPEAWDVNIGFRCAYNR